MTTIGGQMLWIATASYETSQMYWRMVQRLAKPGSAKTFANRPSHVVAEITYHPISDKDKKRCHQMGQKVLSGIFLGYIQHAGGFWTNDLQIIDWEEIDTAEHKSDVYPKRVKAGEIKVVKVDDKFHFPLATGELRQPRSDGNVRRRQRRQRAVPEPSSSSGEQQEDDSDEAIAEEPVKEEPEPELADSWGYQTV